MVHPGGEKILLAAGKSLEPFWSTYTIHGSDYILELLQELKIGKLKNNADVVIDCPYVNEPARASNFHINSVKPFDAEPLPEILTKEFVTSNENFFVRNHLPVPLVDGDEYRLEIRMKNGESVRLSLSDLKEKFRKHTIMATLQCAGNRRGEMAGHKPISGATSGISAISNATWSGVLLRDVLRHAGLDEEDADVRHIHFEGLDVDPAGDPYGASIPIEKAMDARGDTLLAYEMNGVTLPRDHGYPLRVVVPGVVGARNVKWLGRVVVSDEESSSHWHQKDYKSTPPSASWEDFDFANAPAIQEAPVQSVICEPASGATVTDADHVTVRGYAWSGGGSRILRVDVTIDGGKTWETAELQQVPQRLYRAWAWTLWSVKIPIPDEHRGKLDIYCKAVDSSHNVQPETLDGIWNLRGFVNNSWHRINVDVLNSQSSTPQQQA